MPLDVQRQRSLRMTMRIRGRWSVAWIVAILLSISGMSGCVDGSTVPGASGSDTDEVSDASDVSPLADIDTQTADGSHACGIFPDTCPSGYNCYSSVLDGDVQRQCLRHGEKASVGASCPGGGSERCGDALRCVDGECRKICDPEDTGKFGCASEFVCVVAEIGGVELGWGICLRRADNCTLWPNDDCPDRQNCYALKQGKRCLEFDPSARVGDECEGSAECNREQVCLDADGRSGGAGTCRRKCNEENPCESGECEDITGLNFGACIDESGG